jgi:hypothetical protein
MLMYYLPGLDVSKISEAEFVNRTAHLLTIREMEQAEQMNKTLKNIFGE